MERVEGYKHHVKENLQTILSNYLYKQVDCKSQRLKVGFFKIIIYTINGTVSLKSTS